MGGGVSSLPAEVSLAEAKELAGAKWQPAWEEKFAEAKISRDEAVKCWKESEAEAAISEALYEKLHGSNRSGVAEALDFSVIVNEKRGQHLQGTREWVFEAVLRWRTDPDSAKLFWLVGGGGTGKSVAAAELLARLLDKQNAAAWHFCKHTEPGRSVATLLVERGADTTVINTCIGGTPPLLFACRKRDFDAMRLCLERRADVNCADKEGTTGLHVMSPARTAMSTLCDCF